MKVGSFIDKYWNWLSLLAATAAVVAIVFYIYLSTPVFTYVGTSGRDLTEKAINILEKKDGIDFRLWYKSNIFAHILLIAFSLFATLTAAVTTRQNMHTFKVWTIIFTSFTAAISTGLSTFHVHQNLDQFANIETQLNKLYIDYAIKRGDLSLTKEVSNDSKTLMTGNLSSSEKKKIVRWAWTKIEDLDEQRLLAYANIGWSAEAIASKPPVGTDKSGRPGIPGTDQGRKKVAGHL